METSTFVATGCLPCAALHRPTSRHFRPSFLPRLSKSSGNERCLPDSGSGPPWFASCTGNPAFPTLKPLRLWECTRSRCGAGGDGGHPGTSRWKIVPDAAARPPFPPLERAQVQAIACEVIFETERPLSRQSLADLTTRARTALQRPISRATVWRILHTADLKPWRFEYWIFPRDPKFIAKAEVILDLYAGFWQGTPLTPKDCIVSSDEKTSIQARIRRHRGLPPAPGRLRRVEFEYERGGALQYMAGWDVRRGCVTGRCEPHTGIEPFGRLVAQVMAQEPYCSAKRVFWVVDNGSSHRGAASIKRLRKAHPNAIMVHTPIHASWLNQVEIYFAQIQRKVLTPNDFTSLAEVESRLRLYEELTNRQPRPFQWKFDRAKLTAWWQRLETKKNNALKPDQYL
ncbi:MAG TPA: IS630 family transposase [Gemmataceae bacterium]|nr:IS630 family transposase [Gemmataceae bacterium]